MLDEIQMTGWPKDTHDEGIHVCCFVNNGLCLIHNALSVSPWSYPGQKTRCNAIYLL